MCIRDRVEVKRRDSYLKKNKPVDTKTARGIKKEKKTRAPGTKRRVLSPYICYVKSLSGPERPPLSQIGANWKTMSDEDKAPFVTLSQEDNVLAEAEAAKEREAANVAAQERLGKFPELLAQEAAAKLAANTTD